MLDCESPAEFFPEFVNVLAEYAAVWLCEINVLEQAMCGLDSARLNKEPAGQALFVERNDFSRLNFADEFRVDGVECTGFARYDIRAASVLPMHRGRMP